MDQIDVSVIVPIRLSEKTILATLSSLSEQCRGLSAEVVLAVSREDPTSALLDGVAGPRVRVLEAPGPCGVPQLRRDAAEAAGGDLVVIVEDHCTFPEGWLAGLVNAFRKHGVAVCGGPVRNGRLSLSGWAQYFTRYTAFLPPVTEGNTRALPGNNACYARGVLEGNRDLLKEGFWEAEFNQELVRRGHRMWMCAGLAVVQHQHRGALEYVPLRYRHGRCYGGRRFRDAGDGERRRLWRRAPFIPAVLLARAARAVFQKRKHRLRFLAVSPLVAVYVLAWAVGEVVGYARGAASTCLETD